MLKIDEALREQAEAQAKFHPVTQFFPLLPPKLMDEMRARIEAHGGDTSDFEEMMGNREQREQLEINAVIDIADFVDEKWRAWNCHQTQFGPDSRFRRLPDEEMKVLLGKEYFHMAFPQDDVALEGLFSGL